MVISDRQNVSSLGIVQEAYLSSQQSCLVGIPKSENGIKIELNIGMRGCLCLKDQGHRRGPWVYWCDS